MQRDRELDPREINHMNNNKIQGIITTIYDWLDSNAAFKVINRSGLFCKSERFHNNRKELRNLITEAGELLSEFTECIDKISACQIRLHQEINNNMDRQFISKKRLNLLLNDNDLQLRIKDLLMSAKKLQRVVSSKDIEKKLKDELLLNEAKTLSNLILKKYEDLEIDNDQLGNIKQKVGHYDD